MATEKGINSQKKKRQITILIVLILLLLPVELLLFYNFAFLNRNYPNIFVNDVALGKLDLNQAIIELSKDNHQLSESFQLKYKQQTFDFTTQSLGIVIDATKTAQMAFSIGRMDNPVSNFKTRINLLTDKSVIPYSLQWNEYLLKQSVASVAASLNEPTIPPTIDIISIQGQKSATVSAGKLGITVDETKLKNDILNQLANKLILPIQISLMENTEQVTEEKLNQVKNRAQGLIGKTLTLQYQEDSWDLNDEAMINFLSIYDTYDDEKIASWSGMLSNTINREPQNALFNFDGTRVTEFKPAKEGVVVDNEKTNQSIKNGIQYLSNSSDKTFSFQVPVNLSKPKITTDQVNDLGIKELIGTGESWFYHSIASRIHNLTLASSKLHGILVPPGEEFSMLKILGNIDAAQGYKPAYIIQNGRTVLGDGGGVCQASTTMFRAALSAGVDIKTRFPHAYRVSYYEANFDVGVDASIFSPTADFTFINDTPGHILIQTYVDPKQMYMKYEFYGTSDGRTVERSKSRMWDQAPPPPDLYQDDPTLPPGTVRQVDWAAWGAKTSFDWKVIRNGEIIHEKTFYSSYRPWQAVYLRGVTP